jgi:uncharacterized protein GlcG (DUF336 family)
MALYERSLTEKGVIVAILKLSQANAMIDAAIAEGRKRNFSLLAVAVLDAGGHVIAFKREDGASFLRFELAYGKAWGALGMGFGSRELAERAAKQPSFIAALSGVTQGRMVPSPGGVLVVGADAEVLGAIGISGDTGDNDEICAIAGIKAAGLSAIPGSKAS